MTTNLELPIGTTLRGASYTYTIERVLGQGTFGITYLATTKVKADGALGALEATLHVAIKEFFMHDLNGRHGAEVTCSSKSGIYEHYRHKFAREAQNLSKLRHVNIVRVLESFEANNTAYYAMEFCEGGSLDALIGGDGLAEGQAVAYAEQIGAALVAMHGERVLHLDLKPGNVMLRKDGSVALIDFGLSKQYDESGEPESSTTVGGGTPGYAPLEQAHYREGKDFPVQMDIYALGATLFKMLTGERPAEAAMLLNEGFPTEKLTAKGVSERTIAVVEKAMSPMKRDRYGSVAEFLAALKGAATTTPIAPAPGEQTSYDDPAIEATVVDVVIDEGTIADIQKGKIVGNTYRVGDYYNDGTKEGVVFWIDETGQHGKLVSMIQSNSTLQWTSSESEQKRLIGASSKTNGVANHQAIEKRTNWHINYPAFTWCANLGAGWYLPAIEELNLFMLDDEIRNTINRTLAANGGTLLHTKGGVEWYWSSTEVEKRAIDASCAWGVNMYNGYTYYYHKSNNYYVRAVSAF